jgi:hypothetical protein
MVSEYLGDTAYLQRGGQLDPKRVFESDLNHALQRSISIVPGYGILPPGCIMGQITESTSRKGMFVPYAIQTAALVSNNFYGAVLLTEGAADVLCYMTMDDSYKFVVGDHLGAVDSDATAVDLGAVASIDRTTYATQAVVSVSNNVTTAMNIAKWAFVFIQTLAASPHTNAIGLLAGSYDTGTGENAKGAEGSLVLSNAMVKYGLIPNYDAGALTDLSGVLSAPYMIMR